MLIAESRVAPRAAVTGLFDESQLEGVLLVVVEDC